MEILYFKTLSSTQNYLIDSIKNRNLTSPIAIVTDIQTDGIGSRGNHWIGAYENLFLSFAISDSSLPKDLPIVSASIYFSYILKELLKSFGSNLWFKWPNDFYIKDKKIGGTICNIINGNLICGIGLNLKNKVLEFEKLDIDIEREKLLYHYFLMLEKFPSWNEIFEKYSIEFYENIELNYKLKNGILQSDGSLEIDGNRVYSLR